MFDSISGRYDLLNRILSLGIDRLWRKKALRMLKNTPGHLLDVATGTGDMVFMAADITGADRITGVDLSAGMLEVARKRLENSKLPKTKEIRFIKGDAEQMPFDDNTFDCVTVAFGVRNFGDLGQGLRQMQRVLRPGAPAIILEFSKPRHFPFKQLYHIYFRHVLPLIGSWTSGDKKAYRYLFDSVQAFPDYGAFCTELNKAGFERASYKALSLGICAIYIAYKPF